MKVGFLLNHYDLHQVPHCVPYAFELSRNYGDCETVIFCSTQDELNFAREIGTGFPGHKCAFEFLTIPSYLKAIDPFLAKFVFARKSVVLKANAARLSKFDALVVPEMTSLGLRSLPGFEHVKLIFTGHGAGDNRLGGSFNDRIGKFDLALLPGRKYAEALKEAGHLSSGRTAISGYPKFDSINHLGISRRRFFENDDPVVVYNPHHSKELSSWGPMGVQVLDYFFESKKYNLIFSPHVLLFKRSWGRGVSLARKYKNNDRVLIDKSSRKSVDMTYLIAADIYLGDVSSQIYEFVTEPRPCVFLNAHQFDANDPSYHHWKFGPVIDDVSQLPNALEASLNNHDQYRDIQRSSFAYTFEQDEQSASIRGAHIIAEFLSSGQISEKWK